MTKRRYFITVGGDEPIEVALEYSVDDHCWWADVDGERLALTLQGVGVDGMVHTQIDGESVQLRLYDEPEGGFRLGAGDAGVDEAYPIRARTDGEIVLAAPSPERDLTATNPTVVCPITGEVLAVSVRPGQRVRAGEVLVVLEAMKMETVIKSPQDGRVSAVHVATGDRVMAGAALVALGDNE